MCLLPCFQVSFLSTENTKIVFGTITQFFRIKWTFSDKESRRERNLAIPKWIHEHTQHHLFCFLLILTHFKTNHIKILNPISSLSPSRNMLNRLHMFKHKRHNIHNPATFAPNSSSHTMTLEVRRHRLYLLMDSPTITIS